MRHSFDNLFYRLHLDEKQQVEIFVIITYMYFVIITSKGKFAERNILKILYEFSTQSVHKYIRYTKIPYLLHLVQM